MQGMILDRVRALMSEGVATRVLGWETGEFPYDRTPKFFNESNLENLKYDSFCGCNLSKYLVNESEKVIALVKPCDSYSLTQLCTEHRVKRENVYALGVACRGKIDVNKIAALGIKGITDVEEDGDTLTVHTLYGDKQVARKDVLLNKCMSCKGKEHKNVDEVIGESEDTSSVERFDMVAELEAMTPDQRFAFWRNELSKCIRCNACRNVCPACTCVKCVFDNPNTGVQNKAAADDFEENMFHIIRAFHVAGRCTDCGECSRVCPQGIPLHLLNRKFIKDIDELYGDYVAGDEADQRHPLINFTKTDCEPSIVHQRGGDKG
ncbi:MAG: 4Fe-4S dicluster domain-containing protein [Clostridia bacterium]|nr:4Fe-4S dicluster domain-containing protein [Clostridia bacterium]